MSLKEKKERLQEIQTQIKKINKELRPLQEEALKLRNEIRDMNFVNLLPLTPEKVLTSNYQIFEGDNNYKEFQKYMKQFKYVLCDGYNADTELKGLRIKLSQKADLESQKNELSQFLPYVSKVEYEKIDKYGRIPRPEGLEGKVRVVSIFEHTCSEDGSYSLLIGDNNIAALLRVRYSSPRILKTLPLLEMIAYIREKHPYELIDEE